MVWSEPIVEAMGFAPAIINLRKEAEVGEGFRNVIVQYGGNPVLIYRCAKKHTIPDFLRIEQSQQCDERERERVPIYD